MTSDLKIYNEALKFLGTKETPGPGSTPVIRLWIKQAASWLDGDDSKTAWCGCFRGSMGLATATGVPKEHFRAAEWINWGKMVDVRKPELWTKGMTAILHRTGGKHVALISHVKGKKVYLLGGNQSDAVTIQAYAIADVQSVRTCVS